MIEWATGKVCKGGARVAYGCVGVGLFGRLGGGIVDRVGSV